MFRRVTILSLFAFLCAAALVYVGFVQPQESDQERYTKLMYRPPSMRPQKMAKPIPIHQVRTKTQKDFWTTHQGHPTHLQIKSDHSDLWIFPSKGKFEITEQLQSIECCGQEITSPSSQEIRWLMAAEGQFSYPSSSFNAKQAKLETFVLEGNRFPLSRPEATPTSSVSADLATWTGSEPLHLTGHVHLFSSDTKGGPTFALADELWFHPDTKNIELKSHAPQKVLLWQNAMRLSSPLIEIQNKEQIKGIGDVHFHFNDEEKERFNKIFGVKN